MPDLQFAVPFANEARRKQFSEAAKDLDIKLPIHYFNGMSREVMAASDVILLASGTAALEAMLLKRPMVAAYRVSFTTYHIARHLVTVKVFCLPNHLLPEPEVPEFIQIEINAEKMGQAVLDYLQNPDKVQQLTAKFHDVHLQLRKNASDAAAQAIVDLINKEH